ncbi:MAG: hypothetical protein ACTSSE_13740 [Candidatus Thorarchaeota archaeon]
MSEEGAKKESSILAIILFGFLSMIFAEAFSGSSPLWFLGSWGWFVTLPLYWAHTLLLINLALRYERTSLTQLYLWGVIFGLYEAWITKVIWAGYMGEAPAFGTFLGFAIGEFLVLVLFWHPVFSFIIPILVFQIVVMPTNMGEAGEIHTSHLKFISKNLRNKILLGIIIVAGALFMTMGVYADPLAVLIAGGINFAFIFLLSYLTASLSRRPLDLESLRLGERGLSIVVVYLAILYVLTFLTLLPERIPNIGTILLTIAFYVIVLTMLFLTPRDTQKTIELPSGIISFQHLIWALVTFLMLSITLAMVSLVTFIAATLLYLLMIFVGPILFFLAIVQVFRKAEVSE